MTNGRKFATFLKSLWSIAYVDPDIPTLPVADRFEQKIVEEISCCFVLLGLINALLKQQCDLVKLGTFIT